MRALDEGAGDAGDGDHAPADDQPFREVLVLGEVVRENVKGDDGRRHSEDVADAETRTINDRGEDLRDEKAALVGTSDAEFTDVKKDEVCLPSFRRVISEDTPSHPNEGDEISPNKQELLPFENFREQ